MIDFTATDRDGHTLTVYSGSYPSRVDGTEDRLGTRSRIEIRTPDGDHMCCDLNPTDQARLVAALSGTGNPKHEE